MSMNILLVEDHDALRAITMAALRGLGHRVVGVGSGAEMDARLVDFHPDILLLDLNLPGEDGLSISQRMRKARPALGIIMVTVREQIRERVEGYGSGADLYLTKPTSIEELTAAIDALTRRLRPTAPSILEVSMPGGTPSMKAQAAHAFLMAVEGKPPVLDEVARHVGLSTRALKAAFLEEYGCTVHALLDERRMEQARQAVLETDLPLKAIAHHLGYSHVNNFIAWFTRNEGQPPGRLRAQARSPIE